MSLLGTDSFDDIVNFGTDSIKEIAMLKLDEKDGTEKSLVVS